MLFKIKTKPIDFLQHKQSNFAFWLLFILAVLFVGLRDPFSVGNDSSTYYTYFETTLMMEGRDLADAGEHIEKGYVFWNNLCADFLNYDTIQLFFILTAVLSLGLTFIFFRRYSDSIILTCVFFFLLRFYDFHFTALRQVVAIGFVLMAYDYTIKRKFLRYIIALILATLFHSSAIIFAPFYLINFIKLPEPNLRNISIMLLLFIPLFQPLSVLIGIACQKIPMLNGYINYMDGFLEYRSGIGTVLLLVQFFLMFILAVIHENGKNMTVKERREQDIFMYASFLGVITLTIATSVPQFERATWYFTTPICVLLPNILLKAEKKWFLAIVIFLLLASYITIHYFRGDEWVGIWPYTFFWNSQGGSLILGV